MSMWTYITGTIQISVPGRTQAECDYILKTILNHLPRVTGSEGDMELYINNRDCKTYSSCDEFAECTDNLIDWYGYKNRSNGWLQYSNRYILTVDGHLRDRTFSETVREFMKWIDRLAKRLSIDDILIKISTYGDQLVIDNADKFIDMIEYPSWCNDTGEPAWWEYLMWHRWGDTPIPLEHVVKYYENEKADKEWIKRLEEK